MTASRHSTVRHGNATYVNAGQNSTPKNLSRQNSPIVIETTTSLRPSDDAEELKREAARRTLFQKISNNQFDIPNGYRKVEVLILRWDESIDDFGKGHNQEVQRLEGIFSDLGYGVTVASIKDDHPQVDFNLKILQHIRQHDGDDNLLIVYYTGHGSQVRNGQVRNLELSATEDSSGHGDIAPVAFWGLAEEPLRTLARADVFSILDCCCASTAAVKGRSIELRAYQLLAASTFEGNTNGPGEKSFTTAFCDSLEELIRDSKGESFSVYRLWETINKKRTSDTALMWNRLQRETRNIDLHHLNYSAQRDASFQRQNPERSFLVLRLSLMENDLKDNQIDKLARNLHTACKKSGIPGRQMEWVKMEQSHPIKSFYKLVKRVQRDQRRQSTPGKPQEEQQEPHRGQQEQQSLFECRASSGSNVISLEARTKVESVRIPDNEFFTVSRSNRFCVLRA